VYKLILLTAIFCLLSYSFFEVYAQQPQLATFQETAQVFIDQQLSNNVTASITLQSTSNQEIQIPSELEQKIRENERIIAIVLTSEKQCVLGVIEAVTLFDNCWSMITWAVS